MTYHDHGPDEFRCICDPNDLFEPPDPTPRAVEGCPAHRVRRVFQQFIERQGPDTPADTACRTHDPGGALSNYVAPVVQRLTVLLPDCEPDLIRLYALLALVLGEETTEQDVHDAWSVWRDATNPGHRSLVAFDDLEPQVQALDEPYAQAIRAVAAQTGAAV